MTVRVFDAARYLCELSGWRLSNLQLQKMLYMADMFFTGQSGSRLLNENFEAWDYGPVLPSLYHQCKPFGSKSVPDVFWGATDIANRPEGAILREAWSNLKEQTPGQLVNNTHWVSGAWNKRYVPGAKGVSISREDMIAEYQARIGGA